MSCGFTLPLARISLAPTFSAARLTANARFSFPSCSAARMRSPSMMISESRMSVNPPRAPDGSDCKRGGVPRRA